MSVRPVRTDDIDAISDLTTLAFGSTAEASMIDRLHRDKDDVAAFVRTRRGDIIGHVQYYKILLTAPDGVTQNVLGLGPMSIAPDYQHMGYGTELVKKSLPHIRTQTDAPLVFVLGHPNFYPRFGFSSKIAKPFSAPWSGEAFMALALQGPIPQGGTLTFPKALT